MIRFTKAILAALCALALAVTAFPALAEADADAYRIEVDVTSQITTVFSGIDGHVVRQMICSTGKYDGSTPLGDFRLEASRDYDRREWYYIDKYKCYVKYPTRIQGPILFHSLPYGGMDMALLDTEAAAQLGTRSSHGCIRLRWEDAQWIAENCTDGTAVKIFASDEPDEALRAALLEKTYFDDSDETFEPMSLGASGDAVTALQEDLIALGLAQGPPTGIYDLATMSAVISFQLSIDQRATGGVDATLRRQIAEAARRQ